MAPVSFRLDNLMKIARPLCSVQVIFSYKILKWNNGVWLYLDSILHLKSENESSQSYMKQLFAVDNIMEEKITINSSWT